MNVSPAATVRPRRRDPQHRQASAQQDDRNRQPPTTMHAARRHGALAEHPANTDDRSTGASPPADQRPAWRMTDRVRPRHEGEALTGPTSKRVPQKVRAHISRFNTRAMSRGS